VTDKAAKSPSVLQMLKSAASSVSSVFVEEVPVADKPSAHGPLASAAHDTGATMPAPAPTFSSSPPPGGAAPDPESLRKLEARLQKTMPAKYRAFIEQSEMLKEELPDKRQRFKVALKTSHTTAEELASDISEMLGAMESAHKDFLDGFEADKASVVAEAQKALSATDSLIASNEEQLHAIQQTVATLRAKRETDAQAIQIEVARRDTARRGFEAALAEINGHLETQRSGIAELTGKG
jgi:hypothetical protein